jgi:hypothetical protein
MATRLLNILTFSNLVVGVPTVQAHGLNVQDTENLIPDFIFPVPGGYTITATSTTVSVTRTSAGQPDTMMCLVWYLHTIPRQIGADANLTPDPFVIDSLSGGVSELGAWNVTATQTSAYNAAFIDWVACDPSAGGFTVTLPTITAADSGRMIAVKNVTSSPNPITIDTVGGAQLIDGALTTVIASPFGQLLFTPDGVNVPFNWQIG